VDTLNGSTEPFGGWVASENRIQGADALRLISVADNTIVTSWGKLSSPNSHLQVTLDEWRGNTVWSVSLDADSRRYSIHRDGSRIFVRDDTSSITEILLDQPDMNQSLDVEQAAYRAESENAVVYRDFLPWRQKVSWLGLITYLILVGVAAIVPRNFTSSTFPVGVVLALAGSALLACYLHFQYFQSS
jgi:hypothetical protein